MHSFSWQIWIKQGLQTWACSLAPWELQLNQNQIHAALLTLKEKKNEWLNLSQWSVWPSAMSSPVWEIFKLCNYAKVTNFLQVAFVNVKCKYERKRFPFNNSVFFCTRCFKRVIHFSGPFFKIETTQENNLKSHFILDSLPYKN